MLKPKVQQLLRTIWDYKYTTIILITQDEYYNQYQNVNQKLIRVFITKVRHRVHGAFLFRY